MYEQRIKTVRRNLANRGLEQMLVCDPRSIHYLTGAFIEPGERFLGLIVGSDARPTLVLNALFAAPADAACTVRSFTDTDDPLAIVEGAGLRQEPACPLPAAAHGARCGERLRAGL